MKSKILSSIILFIACSVNGQQTIKTCPESKLQFEYFTISTSLGDFIWSIDGIEQNIYSNTITINWVGIPLGVHTIEVYQITNDSCESNYQSFTVLLEECDNSLLYVPNAFTPDGDQHNNYWQPICSNCMSLETLIYNRWGELIFESSDLNPSWDGTFKGYISPDGVYVYRIRWTDINNIKTINVGHIVLIR
jgi:gliding motility-associated-like protein